MEREALRRPIDEMPLSFLKYFFSTSRHKDLQILKKINDDTAKRYFKLKGSVEVHDLNVQYISPIPEGIRVVRLDGCRSLRELPTIPESVEELYLNGCDSLVSLPPLPSRMKKLDIRWCRSLKNIDIIPEGLTRLELYGCDIRTLISLPCTLDELNINKCDNLERIGVLSRTMKRFSVYKCPNLRHIEQFSPSMKEIFVCGCRKMDGIPELPANLETLSLQGSDMLRIPETIPDSLTIRYSSED